MKFLKLTLIACLAVSTLAACAKSSDSDKTKTAADGSGQALADKEGNCSRHAVDLRNQLASDARAAIANKTEANAQSMINSCVTYREFMGGNSCDAVNTSTGAKTGVSYSGDLQRICDLMIKEGAAQSAQDMKDGKIR